MIIFLSTLTCLLHAGQGRRVHSPIERLQSNPLQDSQQPGKLSTLRSFENLLSDLKPTAAFNPSGLNTVHTGRREGPLTSRRSLRPHGSNQVSMVLQGAWRTVRQTGTVQWWDISKAYGFIKMDNNEKMYVNAQGIDVSQKVNGIMNLVEGERVEFSVGKLSDGRMYAMGVTGPLGGDLRGGDFAQEGVGSYGSSRRDYATKVKDDVRGTVRKWISDKAFGFITADTGEDCFVQRSYLDEFQKERGVESLAVGERVQFNIRADADGNMAAFDVTGADGEDLTNGGPGKTNLVGKQRIRGTVKMYNIHKRWGFIEPEIEGDEVFVHHNGINPEQRAKGVHHLVEGEKVDYRIEMQPDGRKRAFDVTGPLGTDLEALVEGDWRPMSQISRKGTVTHFDTQTGWGVITQDDGQEFFVHTSGIDAEQREMGILTLLEGEVVQFSVLSNKLQAVDVTGSGGADLQSTREGKLPENSKEPLLKEGIAGNVVSYDEYLQTGVIAASTLNDGARVEVHPHSIDVSQQANGIYHLNMGEAVEFNIEGTSLGTLRAVDVTGPKGTSLQGTVEDTLSKKDFIGIVEYFRPEAGWGYIAKMDGDKIYVHHTGIVPDEETKKHPILVEGEKVRFKILTGRDGDKAVDVTIVTESELQETDFLIDPQERVKGVVLQFNPLTKTGFVRSDTASEPIFLHAEDIVGNPDKGQSFKLEMGDPLEFRVERIDGQTRALDITGPDGADVVSKEAFIGRLSTVNHRYGFIRLADGRQVFVHTDYTGQRELVDEEKVEFHIQIGRGGKPRAVGVREFTEDTRPSEDMEQGSQEKATEGRVAGTVRWFNEMTGWGFIVQDNLDEVFVHSSAINEDQKAKGVSELAEGDRVEFTVVTISGDKKKAVDVTVLGGADLQGATKQEEQDETGPGGADLQGVEKDEEQDAAPEPELAVR